MHDLVSINTMAGGVGWGGEDSQGEMEGSITYKSTATDISSCQ